MKRLLQFRILIVLIALALIPAATLPFAERLRAEWARFWEPKPNVEVPISDLMEATGSVPIQRVNLARNHLRVWSTSADPGGSDASPNSSLRFSEAQELGEAAGAVNLSLPAIER